eukprot:gene6353-2959_t
MCDHYALAYGAGPRGAPCRRAAAAVDPTQPMPPQGAPAPPRP